MSHGSQQRRLMSAEKLELERPERFPVRRRHVIAIIVDSLFAKFATTILLCKKITVLSMLFTPGYREFFLPNQSGLVWETGQIGLFENLPAQHNVERLAPERSLTARGRCR